MKIHENTWKKLCMHLDFCLIQHKFHLKYGIAPHIIGLYLCTNFMLHVIWICFVHLIKQMCSSYPCFSLRVSVNVQNQYMCVEKACFMHNKCATFAITGVCVVFLHFSLYTWIHVKSSCICRTYTHTLWKITWVKPKMHVVMYNWNEKHVQYGW